MIIIDFSQIAIAAISLFMGEVKSGTEKEVLDLSRHSIISSLLNYKRKYGREYGELVIACDDHHNQYWRKQIFEHYKSTRKKEKETSDIPWPKIYHAMDVIRTELIAFFPWKTLVVPHCEADDIFAVLTKWVQTNNLQNTGIYDEPQPVLLVASDGDDVQLTQYDGVRQWCPLQKKFLPKLSKTDLKKFMIDHIVKGDGGDGIPNIYTEEDFYVRKESGDRQRAVYQEILDLFFEHGEKAFDYFPRETYRDGKKKVLMSDSDHEEAIRRFIYRYKRNELLVIYDKIPEHITESIIEAYKQKPNGTKDLVRKYFIKNRCRLLMDELDSI